MMSAGVGGFSVDEVGLVTKDMLQSSQTARVIGALLEM